MITHPLATVQEFINNTPDLTIWAWVYIGDETVVSVQISKEAAQDWIIRALAMSKNNEVPCFKGGNELWLGAPRIK